MPFLAAATGLATAISPAFGNSGGSPGTVITPAPIELEQQVSFGGARKGTLEPTTAIVLTTGIVLAVGAYALANKK